MVIAKLKGVSSATKRLADGRKVKYFYAWRGGPRLEGIPGSPEFLASYTAAHEARQDEKPNTKTFGDLIIRYKEAELRKLADRTKVDYLKHLDIIRRKFGSMPIAALNVPRVRGVFLDWRDKLAKDGGPRQADYAIAVLARVLAWAADRTLINANPMLKPGRLYRSDRKDKIWSEEDEARFLAVAPQHMRLPILLALWTGQRQGDLLALPWSAYDGATIRLQQGKTGARMLIPVGAPLRAEIEATPRRGILMLLTGKGTAWTQDNFGWAWRHVCAKAGIKGLTFHDLRGTAVTRLALAGCGVPEIAAITGHSTKTAHATLDAYYLSRDPRLAQSAIRKLEAGTKNASQPSNRVGDES